MIRSERKPMNSSGWFLDSGNLEQVKKWQEVVGGITTNQLILFEKDNIFNIPEHLTKMCEIVGSNFPISIELPDSQASLEEMINLAVAYHDMFPKNTVVKVPIIPDDVKGLKVISALVKRGIQTNATIGINEAQLMLAAEASRRYCGEGATYISLFWGRAMENEKNGEGRGPREVLDTTLTYLANHNLDTRVIIGSVRESSQVIEAFEQGADIVTVPPKILDRIMFTTRGQETVEQFDAAYHKVKDDPRLKLI
jgi:transaldolase